MNTNLFQSAYYGQGFNAKDSKHNCAIHTVLEYPGGYQFSVMSATYNGGARLDPGVSGMLESSYFFSSSPGTIVGHVSNSVAIPILTLS